MDIFGIDLNTMFPIFGVVLAAVGAFIPKYQEAKAVLKTIMDAVEDHTVTQEEEKKITKALKPFLGDTDLNIGFIGTVIGILTKLASLFVPKYRKIYRAISILTDAIQDEKITQEEEKQIAKALKAIFD